MLNINLLVTLVLLCVVATKCQECSQGPPMQPNNDCCKVNLPPQQEQCLERISEQWNEFRQAADKENFKISGDMCTANCFLNDTNVLTADNKINSAEAEVVLLKLLGAEWQSVVPNMIKSCKDRIDNNSNPDGNGPHGNGKGPHSLMANCNMTKEKLVFCLREQFLMNCPNSIWKNDEDCNEMRNYLKNCPHEKRSGPRRPQ